MYALTAVTAGAIGHKKAIMCNGANMAFERKVFLALNPYQNNLHISLYNLNNSKENAEAIQMNADFLQGDAMDDLINQLK